MPAKASCAIKTRTVKQAQKNGDIYVIERQTQYDPVKKSKNTTLYCPAGLSEKSQKVKHRSFQPVPNEAPEKKCQFQTCRSRRLKQAAERLE